MHTFGETDFLKFCQELISDMLGMLGNKGQGKNVFSASNIHSKKHTQMLP